MPNRAAWFPFVTWAQGLADLSAGFGAKPGFGHDYRNAFVAGWAAVLPPSMRIHGDGDDHDSQADVATNSVAFTATWFVAR